jgi:hypothetical protein
MLTGNAGTSDLVGMPAVHDLGSLHKDGTVSNGFDNITRLKKASKV